MNSNDPHSFPAVAVALIIATGTVLAGMDAFAKFLALEVPIIMVLWGRYFFHTVITFGSYSIKTRSLQFLRARRPGLQLIRALALFWGHLLHVCRHYAHAFGRCGRNPVSGTGAGHGPVGVTAR